MKEDTIQDIINDAHALAKADVAADLTRWGVESIADRLEKLVAKSAGGAADPLNTDDPKTSYARLFECPSLNFKLSQFQSPQAARYIGYFEPVVKPGCGKAPQNAKHVYEIRIDRTVKPYEAVACCDGNFLFSVKSNNYQVAKFGAVKTLFGRMRHTCKGTRRNIAAKEGK